MVRGDIYYVFRDETHGSVGAEIVSGRPAIVVSNEHLNSTSSVVEVVYLTTQEKPDMPTHVTINSSHRTSTAICEQIQSVSRSRIGNYIGRCSDEELAKLNVALCASLELDGKQTATSSDVQESDRGAQESENPSAALEIAKLKAERDVYRQMYEDLVSRMCSTPKSHAVLGR